MRKWIFFSILILGLGLGNFAFSAQGDICAVYFTGVGCSHCARTDSVVLQDLVEEFPNLIVIEYEIYQQKEHAPLLYQYDQNYGSGLGIPLIIFNKQKHIVGDRPILNQVRGVIEEGSNPCLLIEDSKSFEELNLVVLPGFPKIWTKDKILIKRGGGGDNDLLKELLREKDLSQILERVTFKKLEPVKVPLSGKYVQFDNAIEIGNWLFQWNGKGLGPGEASDEQLEEESGEEEPSPASSKPESFTLAKVLSLGAVDAVNPCALAVLSLMLIAILSYNPAKRRNVLLAGLAFVFSVFVMYLIYGLVIVKSFQVIQTLTSIRLLLYKILGGGAVILGVFKLRDFVRNRAVCKVSPRVNKVISKITSPTGAFVVGVFVTIFLLPCTIGPYIICGGILSSLCLIKVLPILLLYNLIFVLPMLIVVLIIYFGLSRVEDISGWQAKNMRYLDLVSGLVILGLGIAMILGLV